MGKNCINARAGTRAALWVAGVICTLAPVSLHADKPDSPAPPPTRKELWVPTQHLSGVLKAHPNAVMLDRAQYEALLRDAEKLPPSEKEEPPVDSAVEEVRVTVQVPADTLKATLTYEYRLRNLRPGWSEVVLPFSLTTPPPGYQPIQSLIDIQAEKPLMTFSNPTAWSTRIATQGEGRHVLRLVYSAPVLSREGSFSLLGFVPLDHVLYNGGPLTAVLPAVRMELPPGMVPVWNGRKLPDGTWEVIPRNALGTSFQNGGPRSLRRFYVDWYRHEPDATDQVLPTARVSSVYRVSADRIASIASIRLSGGQPPPGGTLTVRVPQGARILSASFTSTGRSHTPKMEDGKVDWTVGSSPLLSGHVVLFMEQALDPAADPSKPVTVPVPTVEGILTVPWVASFLVDADVQLRTGDFDRLSHSPDEDELASLKDGFSYSVTQVREQVFGDPSFKGVLTSHPRFMGAYRFDAVPEAPVVQIQRIPDRFSVDADALVEVASHEVNIVRTLVFHGEAGSTSRAVVTLPEGEVFLEVPVNSGESALWKQVGRDIEVTWPKGLRAGTKTSLTVRTRRDVSPQASDGSGTDKVPAASIAVSGASRVSGYVALAFDESWKVNVTEAAGLETRDARITPVRGRMAWFGLKDWKLGFDLTRQPPVYDALVTAYALPRAKQVEIEGQITLTVTGAPLRRFSVKLPPALAPLFRVSSPLVGERTIDDATGVWTLVLTRELMGSANVRFRMSMPAEGAIGDPAGAAGAPAASGSKLTALLPRFELPTARRTAGRWVIEANTDTEIAFTTKGVQPLDSLRPPGVEGYTTQHRVIAAFGHGGSDHEIRLTATRHDSASLAGMVALHVRLTSVLGQDGSARHEAAFTLRHNGRQFATVRLPGGAELLSTMVDGKAVKPVRAGENEVRLPLVARVGYAGPVEVKVLYETPAKPWATSGRVALEPPTLGSEVPVVETVWNVHTPSGYTVTHQGSGLMQKDSREVPSLLGWFNTASREVDFLPGGARSYRARETAQQLADSAVSIVMSGITAGDEEADQAFTSMVTERMNRIILPTVQFNGASVEEALEFLRIHSRDYDPEPDPARKGFNMIIKPGTAPSTAQISLDLKDVPLIEALKYVTELGQMKFRITRRGIEVVPLTDLANEQYTRKFKLPMAGYYAMRESAGASSAGASQGQPVSVTDVDLLKAQGIPFPEGATAVYDRESQILIVRNTTPSLDLVEAYIGEHAPPPPGKWKGDGLISNVDELTKSTLNPGAHFSDKLSRIIFPTVQFNNATIEEAVEFLRIKSRDYDPEPDPYKKGVNLIIKPGSAPSNAQISLDLKDVPMIEALKYITELGQMKFKVEPYAVVVVPITDITNEMFTRTFKVPPDFLSWSENDSGAAPDPFATASGRQLGGLQSRSGSLDVLRGQGIPFPEGATAAYIPSTNQLIVRHNSETLDKVEAYVNELMADYRRANSGKAKSGLVPLELEIPTSGEVLTLAGQQRPAPLTLKYSSWEGEMARTSFFILLGLLAFWRLGRARCWFATLAAILVLTCVPLVFAPSVLPLCNALLLGWLIALALHLIWRIAHWWSRRTGGLESTPAKEVAV